MLDLGAYLRGVRLDTLMMSAWAGNPLSRDLVAAALNLTRKPPMSDDRFKSMKEGQVHITPTEARLAAERQEFRYARPAPISPDKTLLEAGAATPSVRDEYVHRGGPVRVTGRGAQTRKTTPTQPCRTVSVQATVRVPVIEGADVYAVSPTPPSVDVEVPEGFDVAELVLVPRKKTPTQHLEEAVAAHVNANSTMPDFLAMPAKDWNALSDCKFLGIPVLLADRYGAGRWTD